MADPSSTDRTQGTPDPRGAEFDEAAVAALRDRLQRAVKRLCPVWLAPHAEDMIQTALMRVLAARGRSTNSLARGEGNPRFASSYLERAAYSALVDEIRRQRRRREVPVDENIHAMPEERPTADPERIAAGREAGRAVLSCLDGLVRPRRLAVTLYLQGHSVPEAAGLLAWTAKRTENLVFRGLADLRRCLTAKGMKP
jgi:RNA polymerase sigma-70 factor (ECF subfamily)